VYIQNPPEKKHLETTRHPMPFLRLGRSDLARGHREEPAAGENCKPKEYGGIENPAELRDRSSEFPER
jgi:hypothetical protein